MSASQKRAKKILTQSLVFALLWIATGQASAELINTNRPDGVSGERWAEFLTYCAVHAAINNVPIQFYGRVEDQNKVPVHGAAVRVRVSSFVEDASVQWTTGGGETVSKHIDLITDENGLFELNDVKGRILYIDSISKEHYKDRPKYPSYAYSKRYSVIHVPDQHEPEVFRILRQGETEPLIRTVGSVRMFADKKYGVVLMTGKVRDSVGDEDAHLVFSIQVGPPSRGRIDWTVYIEAPRGGILESEDDFDLMLEAPQVGYVPHIQWKYSKDDPKYTGRLSRNIYFRSNDGSVFAAIKVEASASPSGSVRVELTNLVNPSGSRNLEYDPEKRIK